MLSLLVLAALLPAVILLIRVYRLDKIEKEPARLLWKLVLGGALSGVAASVAEGVLITFLSRFLPAGTLLYQILLNFGAVALVEELCKRWPVKRLAWNDEAFDYRFDAVVYCVFSALGFAALENLLYVLQFGLSVAITRALLSVPGHFFFAVYMGVFLGEAKKQQKTGRGGDDAMRRSLLVPVLLHGFWDFCLSMQNWVMTLVFYAFVILFFLIANKSLKKASADDEKL